MKKISSPLLAVLLLAPLARAFSAEGAPAVPAAPPAPAVPAAPAAPAAASAVSQLGASAGQDAAAIEQEAQKLKEESRKLFRFAAINGKMCLVARPDQLDHPYLFSATIAKGTGENGTNSAEDADTFLWTFHRTPQGDKLQFVRLSTDRRADKDSPEQKTIESSYSDSVLFTLPIVSMSTTTGEVAVPAEPLFLFDFVDVSDVLRRNYGDPALHLSESESYIEKVMPLPTNLEVSARLSFDHSSAASSTLPDGRVIPITMHYSISVARASEGFEPRQADPRIGYFDSSFEDYSRTDLKGTAHPLVSLMNRWNLQKKDPGAPVSDVKNPIVYWLDDTIPQEYREPIRAGILSWNAAFEAIGLRNAIAVKEVDKDMPKEERAKFDPADASYNVIRWFMGEDASFAEGPHRSNPITGEIFNASVRVGYMLPQAFGESAELSESSSAPRTIRSEAGELCGDAAEIARQASSSLAILEARGAFDGAEKKRFMRELITWITLHEIGHTLGLRHNFRTSELLPTPAKHSDVMETGFMNDFGAPSSVMAYLPANIAGPGEKQGAYYMTKPGVYDFWAIEYGYKPLSGAPAEQRRQLDAVAARSSADPRLAYGTDEDVNGIDPSTQRFIIGSDPVAYARHQVTLVRDLWKRVEEEKNSPEKTYGDLRTSFSNGVQEYMSAVAVVLPVIGGVRSNRVLRPGETSRTPYEPVSAEEQRRALKFLDEQVFDAKAIQASPELLVGMGEASVAGQPAPFALADVVLSSQRRALYHIYAPSTLKRLQDSEVYAAKPGYVMGPAETMAFVRESIWKEISGKKPSGIPLVRRNLQTEHVSVLAKTLINPATPNGARDAARRDMAAIAADIRRALASKKMDDATRLHLETAGRSIAAVLSENGMNAASVLNER